MTQEEAIKIMNEELGEHTPHRNTDFYKACELGIEALKFYLDSSHYAVGCLLPGETRETEE